MSSSDFDSKLDAYVGATVARHDLQQAHRVLSRFMCRCLSSLLPILPAIGQSAYRTAWAYWMQDQSSAAELTECRTQCWAYLDQRGESSKLDGPETIALRAALCVLYAEVSDADFSAETVDWFVMLLLRLGKTADEILAETSAPDEAPPMKPAP